jgi:DNA replication protein DnaC
MTDPVTYDVSTPEGLAHRTADTTDRRIPARFRAAVASDPSVLAWCEAFARGEVSASLLILGPTGVGKTYQAYGAIRHLAALGISVHWEATTAPDLYAELRPRDGHDPEAAFSRFVTAGLLMIDDIGAAKASEWTEEVNYRITSYRHDRLLPMILTSNLPAMAKPGRPSLAAALGERVMSRISGMCEYAVLTGPDRRRSQP